MFCYVFKMSVILCSRCQSTDTVKYGHTHYGKQRFKCQNCDRQFVQSPSRQPIPQSTRDLIDKLLLERLSLAAIIRVTGVSKRWLQYYAKHKYYQISKQPRAIKKSV